MLQNFEFLEPLFHLNSSEKSKNEIHILELNTKLALQMQFKHLLIYEVAKKKYLILIMLKFKKTKNEKGFNDKYLRLVHRK